MANLEMIDFKESLLKEREDLKHQIKQLMFDYEILEPGSAEELALGTTIASLRINFCKVQQKILNNLL